MRLLYLCDATSGGISEYSLLQIRALCKAGADITLLCRPEFRVASLGHCRVEPLLPSFHNKGSVLRKLFYRIRDGRTIAKIASEVALRVGADRVLMACYSEYFSPFWAPIYRKLVKNGIPIATIAHDPVRDFVFGPKWWHHWSVQQGYSFVSDVFVHDDTPVDFGGKSPKGVKIHQIPCGPFPLSPPLRGRWQTRELLGFSASDRVFLAFGQIRNGKNLDRFIRAMVSLPVEVKLLVAGSPAGGSQQAPGIYQKLAQDLGVTDRCVWDIRYIPDEETGDFFAASDYVLMTYSPKFRSASGVMNAAVTVRKPILGSSGAGPFRTAMEQYKLGVFVEPDDDSAILEGAKLLLDGPLTSEWDRYELENSWPENAKRVLGALDR